MTSQPNDSDEPTARADEQRDETPADAGGAGLAAALDGSGLSVGVLVVVLCGWVVLGVGVAAVALRSKRI